MFEEFAVLLSGQAELLNNIEKNLEGANDYLEDADVQLTKARETHEDGQKQLCCCLCCVFCLLIILFAVLFGIFS